MLQMWLNVLCQDQDFVVTQQPLTSMKGIGPPDIGVNTSKPELL
jgi:hypothetical protein